MLPNYFQIVWYFVEESQYVIGERGGTLTVRVRRGGYQSNTDAVTVGMGID